MKNAWYLIKSNVPLGKTSILSPEDACPALHLPQASHYLAYERRKQTLLADKLAFITDGKRIHVVISIVE